MIIPLQNLSRSFAVGSPDTLFEEVVEENIILGDLPPGPLRKLVIPKHQMKSLRVLHLQCRQEIQHPV